MLNKYSALVLGAVLGLGTLAFTGPGASAAAMLPLSPVASSGAPGIHDGIIQAGNRNNNEWKKNKGWKNNKWKKKRSHNRHRRHGSHFGVPLIIGGGFGGYNYYNNYYDDYDYYDYDDYDDFDGGGWSSRHVRYCLNRYQSYNPRNNTWVAYSGRVHQCRSPYL